MAANDVPCCEPMFWVYLVISVGLVSFAGLMSGLTLGLMSLSLVDVEILAKAGQPHERKNAAKILPIVKNQHLLLCTLLIWNSLAMEALPIFLDALLPAWGAILISVTLILAFGEIIPQSICSRYGLSVGAKLSGVVRLLMILIFPLSYPISKVLDCILGKGHSALLRRAELKMFVDMHGNEAGKGGELTHDETTIITGALDMTQKTVKVAMTPISDVFSLSVNSKLDENTMELIINKGHSRIPIYSDSPTNIIGLILVKNLIKARPEHETLVKDVTIRNIPRVKDSLPLYDILNQFQKGHSHMAVVVRSKKDIKECTEYITAKTTTVAAAINGGYNGRVLRNSPSSYSETMKKYWKKREWKDDWETTSLRASEEVVGIITLEDVIEELLQEEILDETDEYVDVHNMINISMLPLRSPVSSYNPSPILRSPITPWNRSPIPRPTLSASPRDSTTASPIRYGGSATSSPNLQVLRKSYEKMQKTECTVTTSTKVRPDDSRL